MTDDPTQPPSPIPGVGAVIWNAQGEIVLIRRGQAPRRGEWSIPGGRVEWGETLAQAVLREVREETGLTVALDGLIDVVDLVMRDGAGTVVGHYVLTDFTADYISGTLEAASDATEARWVSCSALDDYSLWSETRRVIAASAGKRGR